MRTSLLSLPCLSVALTLLTVAAAFGESPPTCAGKALPEIPLTADTECATEAGVTLTVPTGWSVAARARALLLEPPGGDSHLMLESVDASDAASAVASAWQSYRPTESRRLRIVLPQEAPNGTSMNTSARPTKSLSSTRSPGAPTAIGRSRSSRPPAPLAKNSRPASRCCRRASSRQGFSEKRSRERPPVRLTPSASA